jgi:TetR/AcrR family transcriptional regulator, transcriptional repressor for nem operon
MRYEKGHNDTTRQRIIEGAARRFREQGVAAAGVAAVMSDAGLTNGAFYTHFESKEDLFSNVLQTLLERRVELLQASIDKGGLEGAVGIYLSARHRDRPGEGCITAALAAEVARHPKSTREIFTARIVAIIDLMAAELPPNSTRSQRSDAIALYGMMIGTLQLARAVSDRQLSDEILESGIQAALALIARDA